MSKMKGNKTKEIKGGEREEQILDEVRNRKVPLTTPRYYPTNPAGTEEDDAADLGVFLEGDQGYALGSNGRTFDEGGVRKGSFVANAGKKVFGIFRRNHNHTRRESFNSLSQDHSGLNIDNVKLGKKKMNKKMGMPPVPGRAPKRDKKGRMNFENNDIDESGIPIASAALGRARKTKAKTSSVPIEAALSNLKSEVAPEVVAKVDYGDRINELIEEALKSEKSAPYNRTKLMVVGEGRAGKTSTIRSLLHQAFDANELSTKGFEVKRVHANGWKEDNKGYLVEQLEKFVTEEKVKRRIKEETKVERPDSMSTSVGSKLINLREEVEIDVKEEEVKRYGKDFKFSKDKSDSLAFSIWDFGGQKVFYSLHHLFLTEYGCYILVFNVKQLLSSETKMNAIEYLKFWLFSKKIHAPSAPVLIVGTHAADLEPTELNTIDRTLKKKVLGKNQFYEVNNKKLSFFPIDNSTCEGVEVLREKIEIVVRQQEYLKKCVPISFLRFLEMLLERDEPYLALNDAFSVAKSCGLDSEFFQLALDFLSERGLITYFSDHETLRRFVILQPQWLISAITDIVYDEEEHPTPEFDDNLARDFRKFQTERVLSKELLTNIWEKKGYSTELQKFLTRVMRKSSLMCQYDFDSVESFLVPSLFTVEVNGECRLKQTDEYYTGPSFVIDFSGNYSEKIIKDDGRIYVRYMPYGFFERLICLCVELSSKYPGSIKPKIGNRYAMLSFGTEIDFEVKVVADEYGHPLWIKVRTEEDAEMLTVRNLVQKIYSMIDSLKKDFFTQNSECSKLAVSLLLPSSVETGEQLADYSSIAKAFKLRPRPKRIRPNQKRNKKVALAAFRRWFCDKEGDRHENLINPDAALPTAKEQLEQAPALQKITSFLPLPEPLEHHCFLSYKQSSAIDMVGKQYYILSSKGFNCWYDQQYRGAINLQSMMEGIRKSMCYILILSRDIFPSTYVEAEVKMALELKKPIMLLHHPETGSVGYWGFGDYIKHAPDVLKPLFSKIESIQLQRRHHLEEAVTQVIQKRLHDIHSELTN